MNEQELRAAALATWTPKDAEHAKKIIGLHGWEASAETQLASIFGDCAACKDALGAARMVLEVGCGMGRNLKPLSMRFPKMIGLDISPKMIELAGEYLAGRNNVKLGLISDTGKYPLVNACVDLAFSVITFQHMPSREVVVGALSEVKRVLKAKGLFRVQTHVGDPPQPGTYRGVCGYFYPSAEAFAEEVRGVGLKVVSLKQVKLALPGDPQWIWLTARK